jgi:hypothetical protein
MLLLEDLTPRIMHHGEISTPHGANGVAVICFANAPVRPYLPDQGWESGSFMARKVLDQMHDAKAKSSALYPLKCICKS